MSAAVPALTSVRPLTLTMVTRSTKRWYDEARRGRLYRCRIVRPQVLGAQLEQLRTMLQGRGQQARMIFVHGVIGSTDRQPLQAWTSSCQHAVYGTAKSNVMRSGSLACP